MGCATPYKTPCYVSVGVTLANGEEVNDICRSWGIVKDDNGVMIKSSQNILGCADAHDRRIVVRNIDSVIGHEMRHLWDKWCQ